jgi:hypothetical protein
VIWEFAFIILGYLGYPEEAWLRWLKAMLEKRGYQVCNLQEPNGSVLSGVSDPKQVSDTKGFPVFSFA